MRTWTAPFYLTAVLLVIAAGGLVGQEPILIPRGIISGVVVEAESLRPLPQARVVLQPAPAGLVSASETVPTGSLVHSLAVLTDSQGRYQFSRIAPGRYQLHVAAPGYRPATFALRLASHERSELSVGLRVEPIALEAVKIVVPGQEPFPEDREREGASRVTNEQLRQRRYLSSDVRSLTSADVHESVTLGETDLFRALQRLPGVSTRDDYSAEIWTRGAPWHQTAVYFDGVPILNPLHAGGAFSAVTPAALGAAFFHPGVQPAELASGGAAVMDLRSRRGGGEALSAAAELSLVSGRFSMVGSTGGGTGGWMVSARRSYVDLLPQAVTRVLGDSTTHVPYSFADVSARWDVPLGGDRRVEASVLYYSDHVMGSVPELVENTSARWGGGAARVTFAAPFGGGEMRYTLGSSLFAAQAAPADPAAHEPCPCAEAHPTRGPFRAQPTDNAARYLFFGGTWESGEREGTWSAGYRIVSQSTRFHTEGFWPYRGTAWDPLSSDRHFVHTVLWGERDWHPHERVSLVTGMRAEVGERTANTGRVRPAPRITARYQASPDLSLSAGAARSYQYTQAIVPAGAGPDAIALGDLFWTLAGDGVPALRADIATIGLERWMSGNALASATVFWRAATGVAVPDPTPGLVLGRPLFTSADQRARGVELSLRRIAGRVTGSAAYSATESELEAVEFLFDAPSNRRHSLDLTGMARLPASLRIGAAYTAASGVRFTRYDGAVRNCKDEQRWRECEYLVLAREPGERKSPAYQSLDLLADWSGRIGAWKLGAFLQVHNALGRENRAAYRASGSFCSAGRPCDPVFQAHPKSFDPSFDFFLPGLPSVWVFGLRLAF